MSQAQGYLRQGQIFPTKFFPTTALACVVDDARETIRGAQIEEGRGLALYPRPEELRSDEMGT